jgi:hypothetical protein
VTFLVCHEPGPTVRGRARSRITRYL